MKQKQIALAIILIILVMTLVACSNTTDATPGNTSAYKVTFMVDDAVYKTVKVEEGKSVRMPADPTKEGFSFVGWYSDEGTWESEMTVDLINESVAKGNITVYAKFEDNRKKFQGIVFEDEEFIYDGLPHMIEVSGYPSGTHLEYNMEPPTEVGSYDVEVTLSKSGYITQTYQAVMTICEASFNNVVFESKVYTYDGLEHSIYVEGCPSGTKIEYDVVPTQTEAGVYFITAYLSKNGYEPKSCSATLIIEKAVIDTTKFTFESKEFYQDGQPKSLELVGDLPYGVTVEYINNEQTLDGVYTVTAHFVYDRNNYYEVADMTATLTIITPLTEYDIFYELNGGENSRKNPATYLSPNEEEVVFSAPSRSAWIFDGWYRNEDFEGSPITKLPVNTSGDIYLYAKWVKPYIISTDERFTVDGLSIIGTVENEHEAYSFVESFNACSDCTWKMYYDYQGVNELKLKNLELDCGWNKVYIVVWSEDELAFTQYTLNVYRLSMCSYSFTIDDIVYEEEATILKSGIIEEQSYLEAPEAPEKDGYEFVGWKDAEGYFVTFPYYVGEYNIANGANFFAEYKPIDYKITYALNDENSVSKATNPASNPTTYNIEGMAEITDPIREGYTFLGWTYEYDNIEEDYDLTLYAQWEAIEYPIVYSFNDLGSASQAINATNNPSTYTIEDEITFSNPRRAGYNFVKWDKNGISKGSTGEVTVVASWSIVTYTISYSLSIPESSVSKDVDNSLNATTYTVEDAVSFVSLKRKGYNFSGWSVSYIPSGTTGNKIIYASWKAIKYHINYNFGDSNSASKAVNNELNPATYTIEDEVSLSAPTRAGYDFVKWDNDKIAKGSTGEVSFNASWQIISYDITYDFAIPADSASQTASNNRENPSKYTVEDTITFNPASRSGYTFVAWDIPSIPAGTYGAVTIKASWEIVEYPITYDFGDSDSVSKAINADGNPVVYTIEDGATYADPTREGYTFVGWDIPAIAKGTFGAKTITARWEAIRYAITYDMGDADSSFKAVNNAQNPVTYTIDDEVTFSEATRDGYAFVSWDVTSIEKGSTGEKTVVASWSIVTYTITYVIDGGTNHQDNPATFTVADLPLVLKEADFGDDVFNSWRGTNSLSGDKMDVITTSGNKTVYALSGGTEGLTYTLSSDGTNYSVSGYTGTLTNVVIGKKYNGKPVLGISSYAFKDKSITSIRIPDSVTAIDNDAFRNCDSLTSIVIPDSVTTIGSYAFSGCYKLVEVYNKSTLNIVAGSTDNGYVGYYALNVYTEEGGSNLSTDEDGYVIYTDGADKILVGHVGNETELTIPDDITAINQYAFSGCNSLTSIVIPDSVTTIGDNAFRYCYKLVEVYNKSSLNITKGSSGNGYVGYYALNVYTEEGGSKLSTDEDGFIIYTDSDDKILVGYVGKQTDLIIPDDIKEIYNYAFEDCTSLTSITIPDSVTTIGDRAFSDCTSLTSVTFGANSQLTTIGENAFYNCTSLTSVTIPDSVTTIGEDAFYSCSSLTSITIPDSVTTIGDYAFYKCTSLTSVTFGENSKLTSIGSYAFYRCTSLTSITIPDSVTTIGSYAFSYCFSLTDVYYLGALEQWCGITFGSAAANPMCYADNLYIDGKLVEGELVIPDSVTTIGDYAFYGCTSLTSITIPDSVTSIGLSAFSGCSSLESMTIPFVGAKAGVTASSTYQYPLGYLFGTSSYTGGVATAQFYYGSSTSSTTWTTYYIPSSLKSVTVTGGNILYGAFYNCKSITNITLGDDVTTIGKNAFYNCTSLTSIVIPDSVTSIGEKAFSGCSSLESMTIPFVGAKAGVTASSTYQYPLGYLFGTSSYTGGVATTQYYYGSSTSSTTSTTYYIPSSLKSVTVTGGNILYGAFYNCKSITNITLGDDVTTIGSSAFYYCDSFTDVYYTGDIAGWCGISFEDNYANPMYYADNLYIDGKLVEGELIIPDGVTSIPAYAFRGQAITRVTIPNSVTTIGSEAFYDCNKLVEVYNKSSLNITKGSSEYGYVGYYALNVYTEEGGSKLSTGEDGFIIYTDGDDKILVGYTGTETDLIIPDGIKEIYKYAFKGCTSLTSVVIPDSVTTIGDNAFRYCYKLVEVYNKSSLNIVAGNSDYGYVGYYALNVYTEEGGSKLSTDEDGFIIYTDGDDKILVEYVGDEINLIIPDSVTSIGSYAFSGCTSLTSITIPDSVTSIGSYAFRDCDNLTSVTFGENSQLTGIGASAFYECTSLTSIVIPDSVTTIGSSAFYGCSSLESLSIPFVGATKDGTSNTHFGYIFGASSYSYNDDYVPNSLKTVVITGSTTIGRSAFERCTSLTSVTIGNSVTTIGDYAFEECNSLTSVTFGENSQLTGIGYKAFHDCDSLTSVTFGENSQLTTIGSYAFYECSSLTSIVIPDSVTTIGSYAFRYCNNLTSVTFGENSQLTTIGSEAFQSCTSLTGITIPDSVTSIGSKAFYDCTSLTSVTFGENSQLTTIGDYAFYNCTSLTSVTIPDSVTTIGDYAFSGCTSLTSITIPDSVTTIGDYAFSGCTSLTSITIPDSVTTIGDYAFSGCTSLTSITVDENNSNYKSIDGNLYSKDGKTLIQYAIGKTATSFVIPDSVTTIGGRAFYNCTSLTSIVIPDSVTSIGDYAFSGCTSLTSVTFGANSQLTTIGDYAFRGCTSLTSIVIPDSVTTIGFGAFYECSSLTSIVIPDSVTTIDYYAFHNCSSLTSIYYAGTEAQWNNISIGTSGNITLTNATRLYYSECVHDNNQWRYDADGNISTALAVGDWIVDTEPTCTTNGSKHGNCSVCGETVTLEIPALGHSFGTDGICTVCGEEIPYTITNDATYAFVETDGVLQSTNKAHKSSSSYVITANTTITITFEYNVSSESDYDKFYIYHNTTQKVVKSGTSNSYTSYSITLNEGDTLTFKYTKDSSQSSGDDCCYIKNLTITEVES